MRTFDISGFLEFMRGRNIRVGILVLGMVEIVLLGYTGISVYMTGFGSKVSNPPSGTSTEFKDDLARLEESLLRKDIPYYQAFGRDPMVPLVRQEPPVEEAKEEKTKGVQKLSEAQAKPQVKMHEIKVICVIIGGETPYAILNVDGENKIISQGEMVGGERVVRVDERGVVLRRGSSERRIEMMEMVR